MLVTMIGVHELTHGVISYYYDCENSDYVIFGLFIGLVLALIVTGWNSFYLANSINDIIGYSSFFFMMVFLMMFFKLDSIDKKMEGW